MKPFPSRPVSQIALAASALAAVLALVSMMWQYRTVKSGVGTVSLALGWTGFALMALTAIGLLVMILSIRILDQLTDE